MYLRVAPWINNTKKKKQKRKFFPFFNMHDKIDLTIEKLHVIKIAN